MNQSSPPLQYAYSVSGDSSDAANSPGGNMFEDQDREDDEEDWEEGCGNGKRKGHSSTKKLLSATEKCRVCDEPAARHIHYGSYSCFSCRAFFRRSICNKNVKPYNCRRNGNCVITLKTRKSCQKCRLEKCISTGMLPEGVLTEEERKKRFRKANAKKEKQVVRRMEQEMLKDTVDQQQQQQQPHQPHHHQLHHQQQLQQIKLQKDEDIEEFVAVEDVEEAVKELFSNSSQAYSLLEPFLTMLSNGEMGPANNLLKELTMEAVGADEVEQIKRITLEHDTHYKSLPLGEEMIKEVIMCSVFSMPLSPATAMTGYRLMIQRVTKVAQAYGPFLDLNYTTQSALLKQNADLLVSLRGAVFFEGKKEGLDQILFSMGVEDVAIGKKLITTTLRTVGHLPRINYRNYNSLQVTHANPIVESRYDVLLAKVGRAVGAKPEFIKLLFYIILFSPDFECPVEEDRKRVASVQKVFIGMLKRVIMSQFPPQLADLAFERLMATVEDLKELTDIKKQRALARPAEPATMQAMTLVQSNRFNDNL